MNLLIKKIPIIFFGLLLITSCEKKSEDTSAASVIQNNETKEIIVTNNVNTDDKLYEDEYAKVFPKDDPKSALRKLRYEKGSFLTKNWQNEDFAECSVSVARGHNMSKKSPEKYAEDIEISKNLLKLMDHVFNIKIIYKEMTRKEFMTMVNNINSQIPEGATAKPDKDAEWYENCIKKTLELSHTINN
jgi:hypothetical protein